MAKKSLLNKDLADLNNDGKLSSYEKRRGMAIEESMQEREPYKLGKFVNKALKELQQEHKKFVKEAFPMEKNVPVPDYLNFKGEMIEPNEADLLYKFLRDKVRNVDTTVSPMSSRNKLALNEQLALEELKIIAQSKNPEKSKLFGIFLDDRTKSIDDFIQKNLDDLMELDLDEAENLMLLQELEPASRAINYQGGLLASDNYRMGFAEGQNDAEMQNYRVILAGLRQLPENELPQVLALAQEGKALPEQYMVEEKAGVVMNPIDAQKNHPDLFMKALNFLQEPREQQNEGGEMRALYQEGGEFTESESKALRNINFVLPNDTERKNLLNYILENNKFPEKRYNFRKNEDTQMFGLPDEVFKKNPEAYIKALSYELYPVEETNLPRDRSLEDIRKLVQEDKREYQILDLDKPIRMLNEVEQMEQLKREQKGKGGEMEMLPDEEMEQNFIDFVVDEALSNEEKSMLEEQLEANPELSVLFDKVIERASEFTGAGPVDGPGTGTSDDIPARLSDGEFVFTAKAVEQIGADNLMKMMKDAEAAYDAGSERKGYANGEEVIQDEDINRGIKKVEVEYSVQQQPTSTESLLGQPLYEEDETSKQNKELMRVNPTRHVYS